MSQPTRNKSTRNILIQQQHPQHKLKLEELLTEPSPKTYNISIRNLVLKHNPQHTFKQEYSQKITNMQTKYYDPSLIYLENEIQYFQPEESLKRYYLDHEFDGKFQMLGEYYKYHTNQPRIFLQDVQKIITSYQEEQR